MNKYALLIEDNVDVNFMQECELRETGMNNMKNIFYEEDYDLTCGPSNGDT